MFLKKFYWKLFLSFLALIIIVSFLFGGLLYRSIYVRTLDSLKDNLRKETIMLGELITVSPSLLDNPQRFVKVVSTEDRITIMSTDGTVLADNWANRLGKREIENHASRPEFQAALAGRPIYIQRFSETVSREMLYYAIPLRQNGQIRYVLRLSFALTTFQNLMDQVRNLLFTGAFLSLIISLPLIFLISRQNSKQIETLREGARKLSEGDLTHRIAAGGTRELNELADDFNQMAVQLREKVRSLQSEHQRVEVLLSRMVEGVIALDENGKAVFSNEAFCKVVGMNPSKIEGKSFLEITRNNDLSEFITRLLRKQQEEPVSEATEITMQTTEGEKTFSVQASPISGDQKTGTFVLLVFHDITRIKKIEQIRRDFVANVSHELRTPLTALKGSTEVLLDGAYANGEKSRKFLEIMDKQIRNIQNLIDDMLILASAEDNRVPLRRESIDIAEAIQDVIAIIQPLAEKKNQTLTVNGPDAPVVFHGDPGQISDAITNLLDNASKYSPQGATIQLNTRRMNGELLIEVTDSGPGIPPDQISRIFERFYRIDKSRSREMGGTGLGLAIAKHAVENHGGSLTVKSEFGKGSTFTIRLPLQSF